MGESKQIADCVPNQFKYGLVSLLLVGCAAEDAGDPLIPTVGLEAGEETGGADPDEGPDVRFDVGSDATPDPCSKVDLLFVIDDSGSMKDEQDALIAAFQGNDPSVSMAAAQSLAKLGNPRADAFLLSVASDDTRIDHKVSAATALFYDGSPDAKETLMDSVEQGEITPDGITQVMISMKHEPET